MSGVYSIAVSIGGGHLSGSPFAVHVHDMQPHALCCTIRGDALNRITSRLSSYFEVNFRDRGNRTTQAVEMDVFVVAMPTEAEIQAKAVKGAHLLAPQPLAFEVATAPKVKVAAAPSASFIKRAKEEEGEADFDAWWEATRREASSGESPSRKKGKRKGSAGGADDASGAAGKAGKGSQGSHRDPSVSAAGTVAAAMAAEGDVFTSPDELLSLADRVRTRRRAIPIQVTNSRPLLIRETHGLKGKQLGYLPPGAMATVIEERIDSAGDVRACVMVEACVLWTDPENGGVAVDSAGAPGAGASPFPVASASASLASALQVTSADSGASPLLAVAQQPPGTTAAAASPAPPPPALSYSSKLTELIEGMPKPSGKGGPISKGFILSRASASSLPRRASPGIPGLPIARPGSPPPASPPQHGHPDPPKPAWVTGWVTLRKEGRNLVSSRVRIEPWVKQRALLL